MKVDDKNHFVVNGHMTYLVITLMILGVWKLLEILGLGQ